MSERLAKIGTDSVDVSRYGGGHPRVAVEAGQRRDDARFGGADDRLIDGREQRREQQTDERADQLRPRQPHDAGRVVLGFGVCRHGAILYILPSRWHFERAERSGPRRPDYFTANTQIAPPSGTSG